MGDEDQVDELHYDERLYWEIRFKKLEIPLSHEVRQCLSCLPLIELHVHMEAAAPPSFYKELAHRNGSEACEVADKLFRSLEERHCYYADFRGFLNDWCKINLLFREEIDFYRLAQAFVHHRAEQNIVYTEVHVSPFDVSLCRRFFSADLSLLDLETVIFQVIEGIAAAEESHPGVTVKVILDALWPSGHGANQALWGILASPAFRAKNTNRHGEPVVVGIGLGGPETGVDFVEKKSFLDKYKDLGFFIDIHCGETSSYPGFSEALMVLNPHRISHGIAGASQDFFFGGHTALCPTSNTDTQAWNLPPHRHPIGYLVKSRKPVSLNSDDPLLFHNPLRFEYELQAYLHGFSVEDIAHLHASAAAAVFCPQALQRVLGMYMPNNFLFPRRLPGVEQ